MQSRSSNKKRANVRGRRGHRATPVHKYGQKRSRAIATGAKGAARKQQNADIKEIEIGKTGKATPEKGSRRKDIVANIYSPEEVTAALQQLSADESVVGYLKKNVSKRALDVLNALATPKTDEALAEELGIKINAIRRILNLMQGAGITNYYIAKNVNGWLSFAWYINVSKIPPFFEYVSNVETVRPMVNSDCNDYFVCNNCYDTTKLLFTFDAAFEEGFKCNNCGKVLAAMNREEASKLIVAAPQIEKPA